MGTNGSYTLISLTVEGRAKRGRVKHEAPDGHEAVREYSWPAEITAAELATVLVDLHRRWLAEPTTPRPVDPAMDLVGKTIAAEG